MDLSVNGGNTPYTYSWSGGQTTQDLSNMAPGTYDVTVTDNNGCTKTQSVTVQDNTINITPSAVTTSVTNCVPPFNGSINLSVSPTNSYSYLWSNNATTEDLANVEAGTYTVTVTFGVTCTATGEYTVADQPNNPNISSTFVNTTCDLARVAKAPSPQTVERYAINSSEIGEPWAPMRSAQCPSVAIHQHCAAR